MWRLVEKSVNLMLLNNFLEPFFVLGIRRLVSRFFLFEQVAIWQTIHDIRIQSSDRLLKLNLRLLQALLIAHFRHLLFLHQVPVPSIRRIRLGRLLP
jgi:hypothetical protein